MSDAPDTHPNAGGVLNRKVGGVPVKWLAVIAAVAVVGGILYRRYQANKTGAAAAATTAAAVTPDVTTGGGEAYSSAGGNNIASGGGGYYTQTNGTSVFSGQSTNAQWATAAANGLTGQGYAPLDVQNALSGYLNGTPLTAAQQAIVNAAIAGWGSPPEGVLGSTTTTNTGAKMTFLYVKDNHGDLWTLINTTTGSVQQTRSQAEANAWSAQYGINAIPTTVATLQSALVLAQGGH